MTTQFSFSLSVIFVVAGLLICAEYFIYRWRLPRPIKGGIPFNRYAANRILGDLPEAMAWYRQRSELFTFIREQLITHDSPIIQLFMRPFAAPWVVISDFRESQDIMARRSHEFDRSTFFGEMISSVAPHHHIHFPTGNAWRAHRRLMADTMSNAFIYDVAGPQMYSTALTLLKVWREKLRLADSHPVDVTKDIYVGAYDAIWAATFGTANGTTQKQVELLSSLDAIELPKDVDMPANIPLAKYTEAFTALRTLADSAEIAMNSPFPRWHHYFALTCFPRLVKARQLKERLLKEHLDSSWTKFQSGELDEQKIRCAVDLIVHRELLMAEKDGREPQYDTRPMRDELFGFIMAGHETTSSTICWGLKFLSSYQQVQTKLRQSLREELTRAHEMGRSPSIEEIVAAKAPYLEATIEEVHRCGASSPSHIRTALVDTEIFGHFIPKGTNVFMLTNGPGYQLPPIVIDESLRSQSCRDSKDRDTEWDIANISSFMPERWLAKDQSGSWQFNSRAGPDQPFGAGPRGCFGRKLASLELKILFTLIIWNFELLPIPEPLSNFLGNDGLTHAPQQCFVRLAVAK